MTTWYDPLKYNQHEHKLAEMDIRHAYCETCAEPAEQPRADADPFKYRLPELSYKASKAELAVYLDCDASRRYFILREAGWSPAQIAIMAEYRL